MVKNGDVISHRQKEFLFSVSCASSLMAEHLSLPHAAYDIERGALMHLCDRSRVYGETPQSDGDEQEEERRRVVRWSLAVLMRFFYCGDLNGGDALCSLFRSVASKYHAEDCLHGITRVLHAITT